MSWLSETMESLEKKSVGGSTYNPMLAYSEQSSFNARLIILPVLILLFFGFTLLLLINKPSPSVENIISLNNPFVIAKTNQQISYVDTIKKPSLIITNTTKKTPRNQPIAKTTVSKAALTKTTVSDTILIKEETAKITVAKTPSVQNTPTSGSTTVQPLTQNRSILTDAKSAFNQKNWPLAIKLLTDVKEVDPDNITVQLLLAQGYFNNGQFNNALNSINHLTDQSALLLKAKSLEKLGETNQAIDLYKSLLSKPNANINWLINLALLEEKSNQKELALEHYQLFLENKSSPSQATATFVREKIKLLGG